MDQDRLNDIVQDPERLNVLQSLALLDSPVEEAFDRLTKLASKITGSPISLVTLVDADRQFFKSLIGVAEPVATGRETPLSHSFCQHTMANGEPLVIQDAREHPVLKDNPAVPDFGVIGYLGMPLTTTDGVGLGSFCVIDHKPREWSDQEIEIIKELALSVMTEIELKAQIKKREAAEADLRQQNSRYRRVHRFAKVTIDNMQDIIQRGADPREVMVYLEQMEKELNRL